MIHEDNSTSRNMSTTPDTMYTIVKSEYGHHSLWPSGMQVPTGWKSIGFEGARRDCQAFLAEFSTNALQTFIRRQSTAP